MPSRALSSAVGSRWAGKASGGTGRVISPFVTRRKSRLQVRNATLLVASLAIRLPEEGWVELERDGWNHFPVSANLGSGPFDFRVTAIDGQLLTEEGIEYVPGGVVSGQGQSE
jgi:expansin (peptidoglycan-binding protein)